MRGSHSSEWRLYGTARGCADGRLRVLPLISRFQRQLPPRGKPERRTNHASPRQREVVRSTGGIVTEQKKIEKVRNNPSVTYRLRMFFGFAREIVGVQPTKKNSARRFASRTAHPLHRGAEATRTQPPGAVRLPPGSSPPKGEAVSKKPSRAGRLFAYYRLYACFSAGASAGEGSGSFL